MKTNETDEVERHNEMMRTISQAYLLLGYRVLRLSFDLSATKLHKIWEILDEADSQIEKIDSKEVTK
jgi:hypothetical protein